MLPRGFLGTRADILMDLVIVLIVFGNPTKPGRFGTAHRIVGRIGMIGMVLTSITGVQLYVLGFAM